MTMQRYQKETGDKFTNETYWRELTVRGHHGFANSVWMLARSVPAFRRMGAVFVARDNVRAVARRPFKMQLP